MLLATVVFFLMLLVLFAFVNPQVSARALGSIVGVDSKLNCNLGLLSVARQDPDLVLESYTSGNFQKLKDTVTSLYGFVHGKDANGNDKWFVSVREANNTIIDASKAGFQAEQRIRCDMLFPLPAYELNRGCNFVNLEEKEVLGQVQHTVITPDGNKDCTLVNDKKTTDVGELAITGNDCVDRPEYLKENFVGGTPLPGESSRIAVEDFPDSADTITVPIKIKDNIYHLTMEENLSDTDPENRNSVILTLRKRASTADCSVHLAAEITNTSPLIAFDQWRVTVQ